MDTMKNFIDGVYLGYSNSTTAKHYIAGYLDALKGNGIISEEEYKRASRLNEESFDAFVGSDHDPDWERE